MENNFEQYEILLDSASEVAEACLDMDGGSFFLAWAGELIRDLTTLGYFRSARLTAQRLYEAASVDWTWSEYDELAPEDKSTWLNLFAGALLDHVMTATE